MHDINHQDMDFDDMPAEASTPDSEDSGNNQPPPPPQETKAGGRVIRRRARKACVECHKRKVRCDVLSRGSVCTNCRLDGLQCVIRSPDNGNRRRSQAPTQDRFSSEPSIPITQIPELPRYSSAFQSSLETPPNPPASRDVFHTEPWASAPERQAPSSASTDMMYSYYDFLELESLSHLAPEDFKFLELKGCFHLPCKQVLDELVRQFFLHAHPALPLLDERQFWDMYTGAARPLKQNSQMSLFLFRCVLFVGSSFLSVEALRMLGFSDGVKARNTFYQRAKLLYDFNTVSDSLIISRGTLLLAYYCSDREAKINTTWLHIAIQHAMSENVHLYYQDPTITLEERAMRKRLWWCCIIRDRILPLGVRRPIQITRAVFDFSQEPLGEVDLESEFNYSRVYDRQTKAALAKIFARLAILAVGLTDVISIAYPAGGFKLLDKLPKSVLCQIPGTIQACRQSLEKWANGGDECDFGQESRSMQNKSIYLFHELNQIYYQSARAALCQYESFILNAIEHSSRQDRMRELGGEIHSVMANISDSVGRIVRMDLARYLPISAVAYLALPMILNSIDVQGASATNFKNESKRRQLRLYNEAMNFCQARFDGANSAAISIKKAIAAARDTTPTLALNESTSTALLRSSPGKIDDWFGVFISQPWRYLRVTLSVDICLASGRFPETKDLPKRLLLEDSNENFDSIPRTLQPFLTVDDLIVELDEEDENDRKGRQMFPAAQSINLDFFDFGIASSTTGAVVEDILRDSTVDVTVEDVLGGCYDSLVT